MQTLSRLDKKATHMGICMENGSNCKYHENIEPEDHKKESQSNKNIENMQIGRFKKKMTSSIG